MSGRPVKHASWGGQTLGVGEGVGVAEGLGEGDTVGDGVGEGDAVGEGVGVGDGEGVGVGRWVSVETQSPRLWKLLKTVGSFCCSHLQTYTMTAPLWSLPFWMLLSRLTQDPWVSPRSLFAVQS